MIRSTQREILLPLSTLEEVKSYASVAPALQGAISGLPSAATPSRRRTWSSSARMAPPIWPITTRSRSAERRTIKVYMRLPKLMKPPKIQIPVGQNLGSWKRPENLDNGLLFDGKITSLSAYCRR